MKEETWKTIAIIFIVLFIIENLFFVWGYMISIKHEKNELYCFYDECGEYYDATYDSLTGVCTCYEQDVLGNVMVSKTKILN